MFKRQQPPPPEQRQPTGYAGKAPRASISSIEEIDPRSGISRLAATKRICTNPTASPPIFNHFIYGLTRVKKIASAPHGAPMVGMGRSNDLARALLPMAVCLLALTAKSEDLSLIPPAAAQLVDVIRSSGEITASPVMDCKRTKLADGRIREQLRSIPYELNDEEKESLAAFFANPRTYSANTPPLSHDYRFLFVMRTHNVPMSMIVCPDSVLLGLSKPVELGFSKEGFAAFNQWAVAVIKHHNRPIQFDSPVDDQFPQQEDGPDKLTGKLLNSE